MAKKEGRVKLPNVEEDYLTGEERKNYELHEKEKNVYLLEEQTRKEMKEK